MLVADGPLHHARERPETLAIHGPGRSVPYGELGIEVRSLAGGLQAAGLPPGSRIGLVGHDPVTFLIAFLGTVHAGHAAVPLSPEWRLPEVKDAIEGAAVSAVIADPPFAAALPVPTLAPGELRVEAKPRPVLLDSSEPFYIGFSSGSTGAPKGVIRSHAAWVKSFLAMSVEFGIGSGDTVIVPGSLFFSFSLIAALHTLFVGGTLVLPAGLAGVLESTAESRGATLYALPSLLDECARLAARRGMHPPGVSQIVTAGEKLQAGTREAASSAFPSARIVEYYGASELGYVSILTPEDFEAHAGSVGRPFLGSRVAILDEAGRLLPAGEVGLLCARTEYGFSGYTRGFDAAAVEHHGWRTAGDLAWQDDEGFLYLAGRRDNMVVIRGENIYPEAIESVLTDVAPLALAVVVPMPHGNPTHLVAVVVPKDGTTPDPAGWLQACRGRLSGHRLPRRIVSVPELPRTPTGKVDRRAVAAVIDPRSGDDAG